MCEGCSSPTAFEMVAAGESGIEMEAYGDQAGATSNQVYGAEMETL